jgi:hypothetical protein
MSCSPERRSLGFPEAIRTPKSTGLKLRVKARCNSTLLERVAIADWYDELFLTKIFELKGTAVYFKHSAGQVHLLLPTTSLLPRKSDHTII